ncbi:hypothetical protein V2J09_023332 [Rumex salicifolius]
MESLSNGKEGDVQVKHKFDLNLPPVEEAPQVEETKREVKNQYVTLVEYNDLVLFWTFLLSNGISNGLSNGISNGLLS